MPVRQYCWGALPIPGREDALTFLMETVSDRRRTLRSHLLIQRYGEALIRKMDENAQNRGVHYALISREVAGSPKNGSILR